MRTSFPNVLMCLLSVAFLGMSQAHAIITAAPSGPLGVEGIEGKATSNTMPVGWAVPWGGRIQGLVSGPMVSKDGAMTIAFESNQTTFNVMCGGGEIAAKFVVASSIDYRNKTIEILNDYAGSSKYGGCQFKINKQIIRFNRYHLSGHTNAFVLDIFSKHFNASRLVWGDSVGLKEL